MREFPKGIHDTLNCGYSLSYYRHWILEIFTKTLINYYVCDLLCSYISNINNLVDLITSYQLILLMIYINKLINKLIKYDFNLIDKLSYKPVECSSYIMCPKRYGVYENSYIESCHHQL